MLKTLLTAGLLLSLPTLAVAADITGVPKIRDGDQLMIGSVKIRPQYQGRALDLRRRRARRADQACRQQELDLPCPHGRSPRPHHRALRGRWRGHPEVDGQQWLGAGLHPHLA
jgi:hypothetical protein